jgi:P-type conjugative transfer protein TrbJ
MKAHKTVCAITALAAALSFATSPAQAGGAAGMATEITQLANNAELIAIYAENVAQFQNMLQNTLSLTTQNWPSLFVQISDFVNTIEAIDSAANASANALTKFAQQYEDITSMTFAQAIQKWRTGVKNQIAESLRQAGLNASKMRDSQQALAAIQAASQSAQGRMQVLQAANQISGLMVNEIQNLHSTIIAAEQARQNAEATKIRQQEEIEELNKKFMKEDSGFRF